MTIQKKTIIVSLGAIVSLGLIIWLASPIISAYIEKERAAIKAAEEQSDLGEGGAVHVAMREDQSTTEERKIKVSDRMGQFAGQNGHLATGDVVLDVREDGSSVLQFSDNLNIEGGKGLIIYFGSGDKPDNEAIVGTLHSGSGAQEYIIPQNINPIRYDTIWIAPKNSTKGYAKAFLQNKNTHINPNNGIVK